MSPNLLVRNQHLGFFEDLEDVAVYQLLSELTVEALFVDILPKTAGSM